jgi:hypothetical protein
MKSLSILATIMGMTTGLLRAADPQPMVRVFLFAGQSNMEGADAHTDQIDGYPEFRGAGAAQDNVLYTRLPPENSATRPVWGPLAPAGSFGPEVTFARWITAKDDGPIAIIKSAIGGTTIAFDWNPEAPEKGQKLYPRTLRLVQESLKQLEERGLKFRLEGVMWHQGENDMLDRRLNTNYAAGLTRMIARFRTDLNAPQLKWFLGEVSEKGIWGMDHRAHLDILRRQQDEVLRSDPLLRWVPTSHLAFEVMGSGQPHYHFGTQGQLQMGREFATAYLDSIGVAQAPARIGFPTGLPLSKTRRVRLFALAGQRNMEGEDAFVSQIPTVPGFESLVNPQGGIPFRYSVGGGVRVSKSWEPLGPIGHLGNFGPELSFGARLLRTLGSNENIAIVKFTHSGAQGPDWFPQGSPEARRNLYPGFTRFIRDSMEDLTRQGYDCTLAGVFWHTGENDTYFEPYLRKHADWMRQLIARVRLDFKAPELPWFISEQHPRAPWKNIDAINQSLSTLASTEKSVVVVPTSQLPHERLHFGTRGTLLLGEALAQAYLDRQ